MSYVNTIMTRLGLDTSRFSGPMRDANRDVDQHEKRINSAGRAHENLLRSSHRVARQINNFGKDLLSGADAADVFATGLEGLGRSLNVSLGALSALGLGAIGLVKIHQMHEEFAKLHEEVAKLLKSGANADFDSLSQLETHLNKTADALERLRKEEERAGGTKGKWESFKQWWKDVGTAAGAFDETSLGDVRRMRRESLSVLPGQQDSTQRAIAEKRRRKSAAKADPYAAFDPANSDDYLENIKPGGNGYLAAVIAEELKNGMIDLIHTIISKAEERTKLSLSDLASGPGYGDQNKSSLKAIYDAEQARRAMALDKQGDDLMQNQGDYAGASALHSQAEQIRNGIGSLKDSEKTKVFQDALDASQRLKNIETNTGSMFAGR